MLSVNKPFCICCQTSVEARVVEALARREKHIAERIMSHLEHKICYSENALEKQIQELEKKMKMYVHDAKFEKELYSRIVKLEDRINTHYTVLNHNEERLAYLEKENKRLNKYISDCDVARFNADADLEKHIKALDQILNVEHYPNGTFTYSIPTPPEVANKTTDLTFAEALVAMMDGKTIRMKNESWLWNKNQFENDNMGTFTGRYLYLLFKSKDWEIVQ